MKVFTATEVRFLEKCAADSGIGLDRLMEQAGSALAAFALKQLGEKCKRAVVLCGNGNNGGDGFVAARRLARAGTQVTVVLAQGPPKTDLARAEIDRLTEGLTPLDWQMCKYDIENRMEEADLIVDAVFGFGFRGELSGPLVRMMNSAGKCRGLRLAADLPSGAECDTGRVSEGCFRADYTLAFTALKPANVLYPAAGYCGKNVVAAIGIDRGLTDSLPASFSVLKEENVRPLLKARSPRGNKGDFGRLLMVCGSYGMVGAAIMAGRAALRCGVGLLNMVTDKACYPLMAAALPEAVFTVVDFSDEESTAVSSGALFAALKKATACVLGCGLGTETSRFLLPVLHFSACPVVVDADGLNGLCGNLEQVKRAKAPLIFTPHPGEMARLMGKTVPQIQLDRLTAAKSFAREHGVYTVLKGAGTLVATPEGDIKLNTTGNVGLAKGGSGDVLAGMIGALLAEGLTPGDAAAAGVFLHGKAGDLCAQGRSQRAMLPTDLIETLPEIFLKLEQKNRGRERP